MKPTPIINRHGWLAIWLQGRRRKRAHPLITRPDQPQAPVVTLFEVIDNNGMIDVNVAWSWDGQGWPDDGVFLITLMPTMMRAAACCFWQMRSWPGLGELAPCRPSVWPRTRAITVGYPHPETKPEHFQKPDVIELWLPYIPGLVYGAELKLKIPGAQMKFEPMANSEKGMVVH